MRSRPRGRGEEGRSLFTQPLRGGGCGETGPEAQAPYKGGGGGGTGGVAQAPYKGGGGGETARHDNEQAPYKRRGRRGDGEAGDGTPHRERNVRLPVQGRFVVLPPLILSTIGFEPRRTSGALLTDSGPQTGRETQEGASITQPIIGCFWLDCLDPARPLGLIPQRTTESRDLWLRRHPSGTAKAQTRDKRPGSYPQFQTGHSGCVYFGIPQYTRVPSFEVLWKVFGPRTLSHRKTR